MILGYVGICGLKEMSQSDKKQRLIIYIMLFTVLAEGNFFIK